MVALENTWPMYTIMSTQLNLFKERETKLVAQTWWKGFFKNTACFFLKHKDLTNTKRTY